MKKASPTLIEDPAMVALVENIVRNHREAAQRLERAGHHARAQDEFARADIIASYLPAAESDKPRKPAARH